MATPHQVNTKEQYEELGHFVEAFESMVREVREICIFLLAGYDQSLTRFVSVALHHQALTAKPLFEIMRALVAEICKDKAAREKYKIDDTSQAILSGVLGDISKEYNDLVNIRNNLLHGTWYIGYTGPDDIEAKEFFVSKLSVGKTGLRHLELPKTADELRNLSRRCEKVAEWIQGIDLCFLVKAGATETAKDQFHYDGKIEKWLRRTSSGDETLAAAESP